VIDTDALNRFADGLEPLAEGVIGLLDRVRDSR
jgi:hypothetical protein